MRDPGDDFDNGDPFGGGDEALWGRPEHQRQRSQGDSGWLTAGASSTPAPEPMGAWRFDPTVRPAPTACSCGRTYPWKWHEGREHMRVRGRWCPTSVDPCPACRPEHDRRDRESEIARRQIAAGIPVIHRDYRWSRTAERMPGEPWARFMRRVGQMTPPHIGVTAASAPAIAALRRWRPEHGSMYLQGPVGSGKSLMMCATVTALISGTSERRDTRMTDAELHQRYPLGADAARALGRDRRIDPGGLSRQVLFVDEEDLVQRVADSWSGDRNPLQRIATVAVLVIDDLGTMGQQGGKAAELANKCLSRIVRLRYDKHLPLLISSNVAMDLLSASVADGGCGYERRTVDRLEEMVGRRRHELEGLPPDLVKQGWSWRRPPPDAQQGPQS